MQFCADFGHIVRKKQKWILKLISLQKQIWKLWLIENRSDIFVLKLPSVYWYKRDLTDVTEWTLFYRATIEILVATWFLILKNIALEK